MSWKPKDKPLTKDEAVALAKRELAPYWVGSDPLLAVVRSPDGSVHAHPLDDAFTARPWLILLADPTTFAGESALALSKEWSRRFRLHELGLLTVFEPGFRFTREPAFLHSTVRRFHLTTPVTADPDGGLVAALGGMGTAAPGGRTSPSHAVRMLLLRGGRTLKVVQGIDWMLRAELEIHQFLRQADPGLALEPPFQPELPPLSDLARLDFAVYGAYPKPGFAVTHGAIATAHFRATPAAAGHFSIHGAWINDGERIITGDRTAEIRLQLSGTHLNLVAASAGASATDTAEIAIEAGGAPPPEKFSAADLERSETGDLVVRVSEARVHHVLRDLPPSLHEVTLRFPSADRTPVSLYGLRVGARLN